MNKFEIHIPVEPVVLKNNKQLVPIKRGDKTIIIPISSKKYQRIKKQADKILTAKAYEQPLPVFPPGIPLNIKITNAVKCKFMSGNQPDASNLYEGIQDWLQQHGFIANDKQIVSHDGSRIICLCDDCEERPIVKSGKNKGKRKDTCGKVKECNKCYIHAELTELENN